MNKRIEIPRGEGYEEILDAIVARITGIEHFKHHTGCYFGNNVFEIRPYYFGECTCSRKKEFDKYLLENPHTKDCFITDLQILNDSYKKYPNYHNINKLKAERANEERRLCMIYSIPYKSGKNLNNICTCGVLSKFNVVHEAHCLQVLPNFYFKPEELKIYWYKTYFRDSYVTQELTKEKFKNIIGECLRSI